MSDLHLVSGDPLARLSARAAKQSPPAEDDEALLREAWVVGRARVRYARRRRAVMVISALGISLLALAVSLPFALQPTPPPPRELALATPIAVPPPEAIGVTMSLGAHRIETTSGTRLSLQEGSLERVSLRLDTGSALFDVAAMGIEGGFEVHAPDLTAIVHGTVFAMTVIEGRTRVDVFEGRVEVRGDFGSQMLARGEAHAPSSIALPTLLQALGEVAAEARDQRASQRVESPPPERRRTRAVTLAQLEAWRDAGDFEAVLNGLRDAAPPTEEVGAWAMVEGDAHRALGHEQAAAEAYVHASETLSPSRAAVAGVLAARLFERLHDDARALAILESSHAAERGAPLEEQALARRALLLARLGRRDEAEVNARDYLVRFMSGPSTAQMERLLHP